MVWRNSRVWKLIKKDRKNLPHLHAIGRDMSRQRTKALQLH